MSETKNDDRSYWSSNGKYQKESDILQKLVPTEGSSPFTDVELYRIATNVYYDIFNNGGGNLASDHGARNDELTILKAQGFEMPEIDKLIEEIDGQNEEFGENQNRDYQADDFDPDQYFEQACKDMDHVMDQVIEKIRTMPQNHLEEVVEN